MLRWALIFFAAAVMAGVVGFTGLLPGSVSLARVLFFVASALFLVLLIGGVAFERKATGKP